MIGELFPKGQIITSLVFIGLGVLIAIVDLSLGKSSGGFISLDLRGILIIPYLIFLITHLSITFSWVYFHTTANLFLVHLSSGIITILLMVAGFSIYFRIQDNRDRKAFERRQEEIANLRTIMKLKSWSYIPDSINPEKIQIVVTSAASGRFAANIEGREEGEYGEQVFHSADIPQRMVQAGEEFTEIFPLNFYKDAQAKSISIMLLLFKDSLGTAPENISIIYEPDPTTDYDGHFIREQIPPSTDDRD